MTPLVPIAMFGWIPVVLLLFALLPARRAVIVAVLVGWMFLPQYGYKIEGLPSYDKMMATCAVAMLGVVIFDSGRLLSFRPSWIDLPMAIWCLCPIASSMNNDLGIYDGLSGVVHQLAYWGLAYLIGRLYLADVAGMRELAVAMVIGALVYVPLCALEIRVSPQLHRLLYGFHQHEFQQHMRDGSYRPMVFMPHGLVVAFWMGMCTIMGFTLWLRGSLKQLWHVPMLAWLAVLAVTVVLCRSLGPLFLFSLGCGVLLLARSQWCKIAIAILAVVPLGYVTLRASHVISTEQIMSLCSLINADRRQSFEFRLNNEDALIDKAMQRPLVGWGGWGRSRIHDEDGKDTSVTDGQWIIALGTTGLVGCAAMLLAYALPVLVLMYKYRWEVLAHPAMAPVVAAAVIVCLVSSYNLPNADFTPVYTMMLGGVAAIAVRGSSASIERLLSRSQAARFSGVRGGSPASVGQVLPSDRRRAHLAGGYLSKPANGMRPLEAM